MQIPGYLPLYNELPEESLLQQFNVIFLFAATTLLREETNNVTVTYTCSAQCKLGFPDSSEERFTEYAREAVEHARTAVLLTVGGHAMNGCWEFCYGKEDKLAQEIADYVSSRGLDGVDFNIEDHPSPITCTIISTCTVVVVLVKAYLLVIQGSEQRTGVSH
jgi:chitinase